MKRQIILLICIVLIGGMAIMLPYFFSSYSERKEAKDLKIQDEKHDDFVKSIESNLGMLDELELLEDQKESELYDESQVYFEQIEVLYDYLKFNQVEEIKEKMQFYIHQNINKDVLDCKIMRDTIRQDNNILSFNLEIKNVSLIEVMIAKDDDDNILDFTIIHSIKE